jgi:hypothetical protein
MQNLIMVDYHILALRSLGAVAIDRIPDIAIGDVYGVVNRNMLDMKLSIVVVDVTDTAIWLREVLS